MQGPIWRPKLVVSDVDGTLLDHRERVSPRMRAIIDDMARQGTAFTLATGRPARWLLPVLEQINVRPIVVCANGAVIYDSALDRVVHAESLSPEVQRDLVESLQAVDPEWGFAVERVGRSAFDRENELFCVTPNYDHAWISDEHTTVPREQLVSMPAVKLLVRDHRRSSAALYEAVAPYIDPALAHATFSWEGGLVEISAPGVSKRTALQRVAKSIEVRTEDIIVFGDMPNDLEMLRWAGTGVAMGNARDEVKAAADAVTATNDDDGVAEYLTRWFNSAETMREN
ncbi:Cof-type HAD-IIB family hydrolase [Corynebacterium auriscanis]|uniref:HAD family hydrolase n=1 Tax=Corynebacterium auriscanis TaxID=99807 RepID=A0A0A2DG01_9CORY|nr:Cof-type HAD-IIB family hydrolase [Corynebacterium auriscanis]KGM18103.1 HAD family hydrolase [Corynebacterium auriscanis]MCX2163982.1 Cof-type HAD-IIB family hydrolase [Corynebacterium auriscanis]WJY71877.1 Putative phosphatase YwpJ [Corynebacterium auriscanis]